MATYLANRGFVTATVEHRLSPEARYPAANVYTDVMTHGDTPHPFWLFQPWCEPTAKRAGDFLQTVLK